MDINNHGFIRVAAASPKVRVADCDYNVYEMKSVIGDAVAEGVQVLCLPELGITGYTCGDLFLQTALQNKAIDSLFELVAFLKDKPSLIVIAGMPLACRGALYNVAVVLSAEGILGVVPKRYIPNNREFYEKRWFISGDLLRDTAVEIGDDLYPVASASTIFQTPFGCFGVEICEDLWRPIPPSLQLSVEGAHIIFNLSASNELVGKNAYRRSLVSQQSARCCGGYVYASNGCGESTTDTVFSGACFIAENGSMLAESNRFSFENEMIIADIDVSMLEHERMVDNNFTIPARGAEDIYACIDRVSVEKMYRSVEPHPFIPSSETADENLGDVFRIQSHGLAKRLKHIGTDKAVIGISGGLDSTLALLVAVNTFDLLKIPRTGICGITMPGFGTTGRTYSNALSLMRSLGVTVKEISIVESITQHFKDIGHDIDDQSVTYENAQARERMQILMDYANKIGGIVVGTGNLSELALGWTTYNGDHMSMYGVNSGVPKTLVATLVRWIADTQMEDAVKPVLQDVLDTPFSPELLPPGKDGLIGQRTESVVGPYELHDFFLYRMLRFGDSPSRICLFAQMAFHETYSFEEIRKWLRIFYRRFFAQQFKRSCLPDAPKVGSVSLSPRTDWRMPSDAAADLWLDELERVEPFTV
ncbi:NAD(+) synthase [Limibacterium fermenti]|uniref:NAD(+) synthase n=1 Tax=Limibacterium fermenti TaxID=3229863 RepID=UPI003A7069D3